MRVGRVVVSGVLSTAVLSTALITGCGTAPAGPSTGAAPSGAASSSGIPLDRICGGDAVFATLATKYDGDQPYCQGFPGDADHVGEGRAGIGGAEGTTSTAVEAYMLTHARAIYTFQPTTAWQAGHPHGRDMEGFFLRQATPRPGGAIPRAYKDFLTPPPGSPGSEKDFALVAVIVSPAPQPDPGRHATYGGVWIVGCLDRPKPDKHEYLDPCPAWVWTGRAVVSTTQHL
jgi:hypothetical protein